ncbi:MAG: glycosyltransferase [bacterium]
MSDTLIIAASLYFAILLFLLIGLFRIRNRKSNHQPRISIVVAARDEEDNIEECLNALVAQTYPQALTQLIVVDDRSTDRTPEIIKRFRAQNKNISAISIAETPCGISPKKFALTKAISHATGDLIFATDADCMPGSQWISETVPLFQPEVGLVIGPAPFTQPKSLLGKLLCLDNFAVAFVSAGACGWGIGVTCTGRNLAYRRQVFNQINGFREGERSLSGDDDLFLQSVKRKTRWRIAYSLHPETAVVSRPANDLASYITQRRRHVSASKHYSKPIQASYLLFNLANLVLFGSLLASVYFQELVELVIVIFIAKLLLDLVCLYAIAKKFDKRRMLFYFPAWEIFFLLNQMIISPLGFVGKIRWK